MDPKSLLHFHFILDHRYNGHHAYYNSFVQTSLFKKSFLICTYPIDKFLHRPSLINLRHLNNLLYPLELLINFFCVYFSSPLNHVLQLSMFTELLISLLLSHHVFYSIIHFGIFMNAINHLKFSIISLI